MRRSILCFLAASFLLSAPLSAQHAPNANTVYQQLRNVTVSSDAVTVEELELHRDAATLTFHQGTFVFYNDVNGKTTGAVFSGQAHIHIDPPMMAERRNLLLQTKQDEFDEDFNGAVLRFTDATAESLRKASKGNTTPSETAAKDARDLATFARHHLHDNLDLRLLEDVLSPAPGGYFLASIQGKKNPQLLFRLDPHGVGELAPEEVSLLRWSDETAVTLLSFHRAAEYANRRIPSGDEHNASYRILSEDLDTTIEKSGFLTSRATVEIRAEQDGLAVVSLDLYPTLRVSNAADSDGAALDYVQERKDDDPDFGVVLSKPLARGETTKLTITYGGKDVVFNEGSGNYYPVARMNWYPNASQGLGDYAQYHMRFHIPKSLQLVATGTKLSENIDGKMVNSEWKTEEPLAVVGFNLGDFVTHKDQSGDAAHPLIIDAFANREPPDFLDHLQGQGPFGTLSTVPMLDVELSQGKVAAQIYTAYFGPLPFPHIELTQQAACNYGQSWPMLVYLPVCGFLDSTQQHFLGLGADDMYWKVVTPHEVAHQWWGQTVGFRSYRDQWMSEGFADEAASIYLEKTRKNLDEAHEFWKQQRRMLVEKNVDGFRPNDVGPVTMGFRISSPKAGWDVYRRLVYPKGAYILHMIRMMMWTQREGDQRFIETMRDFAQTYSLRAATTEDFKAMVEKHMTPQMDLDGNHRMDWFFDEYVYGTDLPNLHFEHSLTTNDQGTTLSFKLTQSGVGDYFRGLVPVYIEMSDGHVIRLGMVTILGSSTLEKTVQLPKLPAAPKRVLINYNYDVLATEK